MAGIAPRGVSNQQMLRAKARAAAGEGGEERTSDATCRFGHIDGATVVRVCVGGRIARGETGAWAWPQRWRQVRVRGRRAVG